LGHKDYTTLGGARCQENWATLFQKVQKNLGKENLASEGHDSLESKPYERAKKTVSKSTSKLWVKKGKKREKI